MNYLEDGLDEALVHVHTEDAAATHRRLREIRPRYARDAAEMRPCNTAEMRPRYALTLYVAQCSPPALTDWPHRCAVARASRPAALAPACSCGATVASNDLPMVRSAPSVAALSSPTRSERSLSKADEAAVLRWASGSPCDLRAISARSPRDLGRISRDLQRISGDLGRISPVVRGELMLHREQPKERVAEGDHSEAPVT